MSEKEFLTFKEMCDKFPKIITIRNMRFWLEKAQKDSGPLSNWYKKLGKRWFVDVDRFFEWLEKS